MKLDKLLSLLLSFLLFTCTLFFSFNCNKNVLNYSNLTTPNVSVSPTDTIDSRRAEQATVIYQHNYVDQPYVVTLANGTWLCAYTASNTGEGWLTETMGISISTDQGKTWTFKTFLEPQAGPAAFYGLPFVAANGRVYVIYGYNNDNVTTLNGVPLIRKDVVGEMCYKYSDDNGMTWSSRHVINMPVTQYDLINNWQGKYCMWWSICKPIVASNNQMYFSFTKLAKYLYEMGEGWVVNSPNINTEKDTSKLIWNFYPSGEVGIRSPNIGSIQEEHNIVQLSNGTFCCVFRTVLGFPVICYSHDNCQTWTQPAQIFWGSHQLARHPRACARIFKLLNGKYALWFENDAANKTYNRNPAWILGGTESNGAINWSQPEVLFYSQDTTQRFSYPDLFQYGGNYYLTQTQKTAARISVIDPDLMNSLWQQGSVATHSTQSLVADMPSARLSGILRTNFMYNKVSGILNNGLTLNLSLNINSFPSSSQPIMSFLSNDKKDTLIKVSTTSQQTIEIDVYNSGQLLTSLQCDNNLIKLNTPLFISISMDPKSRVLRAMVNGVLCNGYGNRLFGWVLVPTNFNFAAISNTIYTSTFNGTLNDLQIYNRALTTGQMLSEYLAPK